jgi:hypothetical protein
MLRLRSAQVLQKVKEKIVPGLNICEESKVLVNLANFSL